MKDPTRSSLFPSLLFCLAIGAATGGATARDGLPADAWRADLRELVRAIETHHFRPYHRIPREEFHAAVEDLHARIPALSDVDVVLSMAEIVALLGDGHTRLALPRRDPGLAMPLHGGHGGTPGPHLEALRLPNLPVRLELFDDGLFVTSTVVGLERLVGARIERIGDTAAGEAVEASRRLAFADNEQTTRWYAPDRLALPHVLAYLGLVEDPGRVPVTVRRRDGVRERVVLAPAGPGAEWSGTGSRRLRGLAGSRPEEKRWAELLPGARALYVQIDELEPRPEVLTHDWLLRTVERGQRAGAERLALDLRTNFGGSSSWNEGIVKVLDDSPYDEYGRLFVLIGRRTFSAAQQLVQDLEVMTRALFVGEPTGSRPGHFGDPRKVRLTHSGLTLRVSTLYWSPRFAGDFREAVAPHLPVAESGADVLAGRDPVLDSALAYAAPAGIAGQVEDLLRRGRTQNGVIHFHRFLLDPSGDHDVAPEMSAAGHRLLDDGLVEEGRILFTLAADRFSASAEAQAGLGRALEMRGDRDRARDRYERALELDPASRRAREALEQLEADSLSADARIVAIVGVNVIHDPSLPPTEDATVVVRGRRITAVGPRRSVPVPDDARVVPGEDRWLVPGLWDAHVHLTDATELAMPVLLANGVTAVRDMGGDPGALTQMQRRRRSGELDGPRIFMAGPYVDGPKEGLPHRITVETAAEGRAAVDSVRALGGDFVKVHNGVPPEAHGALLERARELGVSVVGHVPLGVSPVAAARRGQASLEHFVTLFEGTLRDRTEGIEGFRDYMVTGLDTLVAALAATDAHLTPTVHSYRLRARRGELAENPDPRRRYVARSLKEQWDAWYPVRETDRDPGIADFRERFYRMGLDVVGRLHEAGVPLLAGTDLAARDVLPGFHLHDELRALVEAGLTPGQALSAATTVPARLVGADSLGTISVGHRADMVLLSADPRVDIANTRRIDAVVADGRFYGRDRLDGLLEQAASWAEAH